MAHLIDMTNNRANMAYRGTKPWHDLGQQLGDDASLDQWRIAAGLDWEAVRRPIFYGIEDVDGRKTPVTIKNQSALLRSDTQGFLGQVSESSYNIVQPAQVVEFYRDMVAQFDFKMETMGALKDGQRIWALAKTPHSLRLRGQDEVNGYLLLSTSYDGKSATRAKFTSVRVVCWNTLSCSLGAKESGSDVAIGHNRRFDAESVKNQLGLYQNAWSQFEADANLMADTRPTKELVSQFFVELMGQDQFEKQAEKIKYRQSSLMGKIIEASLTGAGNRFASAKDTMWGLLNGVTEYYDHRSQKDDGKRLNSALFDAGEKQKNKAAAIILDLCKQAA